MTGRPDPQRRSASSAPTSAACIVAAVASLLAEGRAGAQSAEAQALFNDGNQLTADGRLAQACEAFDASNRIEPRAGTLILLGGCREQIQQLASAWSAYQDALARAKNPRYRQIAEARIAALEPRLSYLATFVSADSAIDGLTVTRNGKPFDPVLWNRALPVDGGDYAIAGHAPGHQAWQTVVHVPVEGGRISVEVPRLEEAPRPPPPPAPSPAPPSMTERRDRLAVERDNLPGTSVAPRGSSTILVLATGGGALALLGGGLGLELWAESKYTAAKSETTSQPRRDALYSSANTRRYAAETFAVGGLAAGAAAVWLYVRDRDRERAAVTGAGVRVVPAAAGLAISGQF